MFGYVRPCSAELKVKEFEIYKAYYCGLCKSINRSYSFAARAFLNYDCAFLSMVYSSVCGQEPEFKREACAFNPFLKKLVAYTGESWYAAGVNLLLTRGKLTDSYADDKNVFALLCRTLFACGFKKADNRCHEAAYAIKTRLDNLRGMEKAKTASLDEPSSEFGLLLAETVTSAPFEWDSGVEENLYGFTFNLGKWIYLIDAWDDIEADVKKKRYNPVALRYGVEKGPVDRARIEEPMRQNLFFTLKQASFYYSKLMLLRNKEILDNIMYRGLPGITKRALEGSKDGPV